MNLFAFETGRCVETLRSGGLILYPTDTVWGIGCDATNESAVAKIYTLKKRAEKKSMIILLGEEKMISAHAKVPGEKIKKLLQESMRPTTIICPGAKHLAKNLIATDETIAIRVVRDEFCKSIIRTFGGPIVSTSANISGEKTPIYFRDISKEIKNGVDHVVSYRQDDTTVSTPSRIIKWNGGDEITVIRP